MTVLERRPFSQYRVAALQTLHAMLRFPQCAQTLVLSEKHRLILLLPHPPAVAEARFALLQALMALHSRTVQASPDPRFAGQVERMLAAGPHFVCPEFRSAQARVDYFGS